MKDLKDYLPFYLGAKVRWQYYDYEEDCLTIWQELTVINLISLMTDASVSRIDIALRPLRDITEKEQDYALKLGNSYLDSWIGGANRTAFLLSKHFDLFGLIEAGLAIDKTQISA